MGKYQFQQSLCSVRQGQNSFRAGSNHPSQSAGDDNPELLVYSVSRKTTGALCFSEGALRGAGDKFEPKAYQTDPTVPIGDVKEAWEAAKLRAGKVLNGGDGSEQNAAGQADTTERTEPKEIQPLACRFHDLRHTAVSRMLDAGVPIAKVAKIVGWSPATMVLMAARYGHFALEELRSAVESISRAETETASPVFSPVSESRPLTNSVN
jgi:hypothetical protein